MWWPLAASWLLMGVELPLVVAIVSRLANPEIHLAAYGGVVFPLSLLIEAPIIMILVASTALCKDWPAYRLMRNFMVTIGGGLTLVHVGVAFSPLYGVVVEDILGAPESIWEPARLGLQVMTPWTMSIAFRRFLQGILIRAGQTRLIGLGTLVRLGVSASMLFGGFVLQNIPGIVVATTALSAGVLFEAGFILLCARPKLKALKQNHPNATVPLTLKQLSTFYWPLALTPVVTLAALPIGSAAISRMPLALESLAVWPVLGGLSFLFRSIGFAIQEVVVALLDQPQYLAPLRKFVGLVSIGTSGCLLFITATPLSGFWFESFAGLNPELSSFAQTALWVSAILPALSPWESFFQGGLVHRGATTRITQAVCLYLVGSSSVLFVGILNGQIMGLYVGVVATVIGVIIQLWWLWKHSQPARAQTKPIHEKG